MSPQSFLVSRQSCSPSSSPTHLDSPRRSPRSSPRSSPRASPLASPRTSPRASPSSSPPASASLLTPPSHVVSAAVSAAASAYHRGRRRPAVLPPPSWDETLSDTLCIPRTAVSGSPPGAGMGTAADARGNHGVLLDLRRPPTTTTRPVSPPPSSPPLLPPPTPEVTDPTTPKRTAAFRAVLPTHTHQPLFDSRVEPVTSKAPSKTPMTPSPTPRRSDVRLPPTPTSPVQIPVKGTARHDHGHKTRHHRRHHRHVVHSRRYDDDGDGDDDGDDDDRDNGRASPDSWHTLSPPLTTASRRPTFLPSAAASRAVLHSPDEIPPSVAALLAMTSIPRPRPQSGGAGRPWGAVPTMPTMLTMSPTPTRAAKRMTMDAILARADEAEQELSVSLSKSPLDVLLAEPGGDDDGDDDHDEDDMEDDVSGSDSMLETSLSTRTVSLESMPSLTDSSLATGTLSSSSCATTALRWPRGRHRRSSVRAAKARPTPRSLTPVSSPGMATALVGGATEQLDDGDPLSLGAVVLLDGDSNESNVDSLDFAPTTTTPATARTMTTTPFRSGFTSNLTASLRALRNAAARSISSFHLTSIPPEDFLTRSLLTIDPRIPYTDERRPPLLAGAPSAALRRYLNPPTSVRSAAASTTTTTATTTLPSATIAAQLLTAPLATTAVAGSPTTGLGTAVVSTASEPSLRTTFTASIQMQTYRVHRRRSASSTAARAPVVSSSPPGAGGPASLGSLLDDRLGAPGPRPRELRENSDFIRIAVMEMAMRRVGKLDGRRPGRARLALPPRKTSARPYLVGADGVPARWVGVPSE